MQKPRRRGRIQLDLLPVALLALSASSACAGGQPAPSLAPTPPADSAVRPSAPEPAPSTRSPATMHDAPAVDTAPAQAEPHATAPSDATPSGSAELPAGSKVLQVGDSFADALSKELNKLLKDAGLRTEVETRTPSYIGEWAYGPTLRKKLASFKPDLVLITLGANEVEVPEPRERAEPVQRLVKSIGQTPCVWILPPLWKTDTGVMQVIKDNAKPCQVLDSTALVPLLPRGPDHIHPSQEGRARWAGAVFDWLKRTRDPLGPQQWSLRGGPA